MNNQKNNILLVITLIVSFQNFKTFAQSVQKDDVVKDKSI